jgi:hypothetical protein
MLQTGFVRNCTYQCYDTTKKTTPTLKNTAKKANEHMGKDPGTKKAQPTIGADTGCKKSPKRTYE